MTKSKEEMMNRLCDNTTDMAVLIEVLIDIRDILINERDSKKEAREIPTT